MTGASFDVCFILSDAFHETYDVSISASHKTHIIHKVEIFFTLKIVEIRL